MNDSKKGFWGEQIERYENSCRCDICDEKLNSKAGVTIHKKKCHPVEYEKQIEREEEDKMKDALNKGTQVQRQHYRAFVNYLIARRKFELYVNRKEIDKALSFADLLISEFKKSDELLFSTDDQYCIKLGITISDRSDDIKHNIQDAFVFISEKINVRFKGSTESRTKLESLAKKYNLDANKTFEMIRKENAKRSEEFARKMSEEFAKIEARHDKKYRKMEAKP